MASDDWLDTSPTPEPIAFPADSETPADATLPALPLGPQAIAAASDAADKRARFIVAWESLAERQRVFLNTWRECRFNARRALRVLGGTTHRVGKSTIHNWMADPHFEYARTLLRSASIEEILSRDNLVARHDDVVETLLTPKPILHQGFATGHYEVDAAAAGKANEVLLRLGGHLKDKDIDVNVGIVGPSLVIQVVQPSGDVIDVTPQHVTVELPEPEASGKEWLDV
jgi:hypothetical protein